MPRIARVMVEDWPFHITHRGNLRRTVFRDDTDRRAYLRLLGRFAAEYEMRIWSYCLMPNHVHLIASGSRRESIPKALGSAHREYSRSLNAAAKVTGHLWANRFHSTALDEPHLWAAVRYVELNPVRARLVREPLEYPWSSARGNASVVDDPLLDASRPFPGEIDDWAGWLGSGLETEAVERIRTNTSTGQPSGSDAFVTKLEERLGRVLRRTVRRCRSRNGG